MPYLNNKQNKNTNQIISRQDYYLTQPCPSEEKQTKKQTKTQHKSHPIRSLHKPLDHLRRAETKRKKEFNLLQGKNSTSLKPRKRKPNTQYLKKKEKEKHRNTTHLKEQTRNTEVQKNEEEIGKLPKKELRIMIIKMIQNLENKMDKM